MAIQCINLHAQAAKALKPPTRVDVGAVVTLSPNYKGSTTQKLKSGPTMIFTGVSCISIQCDADNALRWIRGHGLKLI